MKVILMEQYSSTKKNQKDFDGFWHRTLILKVNFCHILTEVHPVSVAASGLSSAIQLRIDSYQTAQAWPWKYHKIAYPITLGKFGHLKRRCLPSPKVIRPKYSKQWPYHLASTIGCGCSKVINYGLNHGLFLPLFKFLG